MARPSRDMSDAELEQSTYAALGASLRGEAPERSVRERLRARILEAAAASAPPAGTATFRAADAGWFAPAPKVRMKLLRRNEAEGTQELLIRLEPGVRVPEHSHRKEEHMVILEGELHLGTHLLRQGDVHVAPPGSWHPAITTERGALILLRCEDPLPAG